MTASRRQPWEPAALAAVTALGALLRVLGLGDAPAFLDNADEIQFSWAGLNLLGHGDAYTWSYFKSYPGPEVLQAYGTSFPMVHHWMDHPPGFSLLMGGWLWVTGPHDMLALTPERVRLLPVLFAVATIPLGYLAMRRALGWWAALAGAALLATAPGAVLLSRQAEPESLLAPLLLGAALLADSLGRGGGRPPPRWQVVSLLALAVVAPTLKITGLAVGGVACAILAGHGRWRLAGVAAGGALVGGLTYALYGLLVDWRLFLAVVGEQAHNRIGMLAAYELVAAPAGINRRLRDGWWILGWIGLGWLALRGRRTRAELVLAWPALAYLVVIMLLAGEELTSRYGWYRLILVPQVMLAAGALAWRAVIGPSVAGLAALLALGGAAATNWWLAGPGPEWVANPVLGLILVGVAIVPAVLVGAPGLRGHRRVAQAIGVVALGLLLLGNVIESLQLPSLLDRL